MLSMRNYSTKLIKHELPGMMMMVAVGDADQKHKARTLRHPVPVCISSGGGR